MRFDGRLCRLISICKHLKIHNPTQKRQRFPLPLLFPRDRSRGVLDCCLVCLYDCCRVLHCFLFCFYFFIYILSFVRCFCLILLPVFVSFCFFRCKIGYSLSFCSEISLCSFFRSIPPSFRYFIKSSATRSSFLRSGDQDRLGICSVCF